MELWPAAKSGAEIVSPSWEGGFVGALIVVLFEMGLWRRGKGWS